MNKFWKCTLTAALSVLLTSCALTSVGRRDLSSPSRCSGRINAQFSFKKIDPNTFVVTDEIFHSSNILVARMEDDAVVIVSSPFETEGATELTQWVRSRLQPKRLVAINPHFHADGTGGNEAYEKAGAEIWASRATRDLHLQKGKVMRTEIAADFTDPDLKRRVLATKDVPANRTFDGKDGLTFSFGEEKVSVIYPGPAHTSDNVVVYFPKRKILFGGCMIRAARGSLGYLGHADISRWPQSASTLLSLKPEVVVPGHGDVGGPELIEKTIEMATRQKNAGQSR